MSIKNFNKYRPYLIPIVIISVCVLWIVRLELKANALASRVDELHKNLGQNKDELLGVQHFYRSVTDNSMYMDYDIIKFTTSNIELEMDKNKYVLEGDITIKLNNGGSELFFGYDKLKMETRGKIPLEIIGPSSSLKFNDNSVAMRSQKELSFGAGSLVNTIEIRPKEIVLSTFMGLAKIKLANDGNIYIDTEADINFTAKGDVNMISENGSVSLFGKTINFNEL